MIKSLPTLMRCFAFGAIVLVGSSGFAQQKAAPKKQTPMPTIEEMVNDIDKGSHYNVKRVLQANDANVKFSGRNDNPGLRYQFDFDRLKDPATGEMPERIREKELQFVLSPSSRLQDDAAITGKTEEGKDITVVRLK